MRVKSGSATRNKHRKVRRQTKGMGKARRGSYRLGKQAVTRSLQNSYRHRRTKKRDFRRLWISRINASCRLHNLTYSQFIGALRHTKIELDRKLLAQLAVEEPQALEKIIKMALKATR